MIRGRSALIAAIACGVLLYGGTAQAIQFSSTDATGTFTISGSTLTITLTDLFNPLDALGKVLTGVVFTFSSAPSSGPTLTGATAAGTATCTGNGVSTTCTQTPGTVTDNTTFFGWTDSLSGSTDGLCAGGCGTFKPDGIVNTHLTGADGLGNSQHVPYLLGPVTFTKTGTFAPGTTITAVTFDFGTGPDLTETGTVGPPTPEPASLMLLGTGLVGMGYAARRRRNKA